MALAIDATATASTYTAGATSLTNTNLTVGAGATCLLVAIAWQEQLATPGTINAPNWDNTGTPQAMTLITNASIQTDNTNILTRLYGLVNPTPGNKTLSATWQTSVPCCMSVMSFSGGVTTSVATAFLRAATNHALSGAEALSLTGAAGNISVCVAASVPAAITSLTATSSASWFANNTDSNMHINAATAPSAATVVWAGSPTSTEWNIVGVDVVAAAGNTFSGEGDIDGAGGVAAVARQKMLGSTLRW